MIYRAMSDVISIPVSLHLPRGCVRRVVAMSGRRALAAGGAMFLAVSGVAVSAPQEIPVGGNTFLTKAADGSPDRVDRRGRLRWSDSASVFSLFFHVDRATDLDLALQASVEEGASAITLTAAGQSFAFDLVAGAEAPTPVGRVSVKEAGYVRVDLQGVRKSGRSFADVRGLRVTPAVDAAELRFVRDNMGNNFYWGRRGPSVHLSYPAPEGRPLEYFYNEITVPEGSDPIGSYFMANGFAEGYFGIQVNSPTERRVLFSVWSPFHTDRPEEIPEDQRITLLKRGEGVHTGEFGNEGSGGQSYWRFPWKAGTTYRFLNRVRPDGQGATDYTAWFFAPEIGSWRLIAGFKRPRTDTTLQRPHSFLENFSDRQGWLERGAFYGNQWARTTDGAWLELTNVRFTGDAIARLRYRVDYAGGVEENRFFLRNGGFALPTTPLNSRFSRPASGTSPEIDFTALEGTE